MESFNGNRRSPCLDKLQDFEVQPLRPVLWPGEFQPFTTNGALEIENSIEPSLVCLKCKPIRIWLAEHPPSHRWIPRGEPRANLKIFITFKHYYTMEELEESCARGCHLCTLIRQSIFDGDTLPQRDATGRDREIHLAKVRKGIGIEIAVFESDTFMDGGAEVACHLAAWIKIRGEETIRSRTINIARWPGKMSTLPRDIPNLTLCRLL